MVSAVREASPCSGKIRVQRALGFMDGGGEQLGTPSLILPEAETQKEEDKASVTEHKGHQGGFLGRVWPKQLCVRGRGIRVGEIWVHK